MTAVNHSTAATAIEELWNARRVAEYLGASVKTVHRLPIPCVTLGRRIKRYSPRSVFRFTAERHHVTP